MQCKNSNSFFINRISKIKVFFRNNGKSLKQLRPKNEDNF